MTEASNFVRQTTTDGITEIVIGGRSVLESHSVLSQAIASRCGWDVANLFAEPVTTRGNGAAPTSISWYSIHEGDPISFRGLDDDARSAPEARLRERLAVLLPLLKDPDVGPLLGGLFFIASINDIVVVDGQPVITNWGLIPTEANATNAQRNDHFGRTLGRYTSLTECPPTSLDDWRIRYGGDQAPKASVTPLRPAAAAAVPPSPVEPQPPTGQTPPVSPAPPMPEGRIVLEEKWWQRPWVPVAIACTVTLLILLYLLIPGVLVQPTPVRVERAGPSSDVELQRQINRSLTERIAQLRQAGTAGVCTAEGGLVLPDGGTAAPSIPRQSPSPEGATPGSPRSQVPPNTLVPPPAASLTPPQGEATGRSLVDLLDSATALVFAQGQGGTGIGTGFFVSPKTIVTNFHVVEKADPSRIFVLNGKLGSLQKATLRTHTENSQIGSADLAILEIAAEKPVSYLPLAESIARLDNVVAAGYPAFILETDQGFKNLREGDSHAIPQMAVTQGVVTVIHQTAPGTSVIAHTAGISPGNSGGPLVDSCGRVVGVNTFLRADRETANRVNYSLHTDTVQAFLQEKNVSFQKATGPCTPTVMAPPAVARAPASPSNPAQPQGQSPAPAPAPAQSPAPAQPPAQSPAQPPAQPGKR